MKKILLVLAVALLALLMTRAPTRAGDATIHWGSVAHPVLERVGCALVLDSIVGRVWTPVESPAEQVTVCISPNRHELIPECVIMGNAPQRCNGKLGYWFKHPALSGLYEVSVYLDGRLAGRKTVLVCYDKDVTRTVE